jgi:hypothetical protein
VRESAVGSHRLLAVALTGMLAPLPALAQVTTRASVSSTGQVGSANSTDAVIALDGRYVAFTSHAPNLVVGDTNTVMDVFVHDRQTGTTTRVSVTTAGIEGNGTSQLPSISRTGQYVAFISSANNLVPGDTNAQPDVFVRDQIAGTTFRVSIGTGGTQGNGACSRASMAADGRWVAFDSTSSNLVLGDTNGVSDVFVHDLWTGTTLRMSVDSNEVQGNGASTEPSISRDGAFVSFTTAAWNLAPGDTNGVQDVVLRDVNAGTTVGVSADPNWVIGNGPSFKSAISANGRYVVFESYATNLVLGDTNGRGDVFFFDRFVLGLNRISVSSSGSQGNDHSQEPSISDFGRYVTFQSLASNLVGGDTNFMMDVFLRDLLAATTERMSVSTSGTQGNGNSAGGSVTTSGGVVAFSSQANNLVAKDPNGIWDVFIRDRTLTCPADLVYCTAKVNSASCTPAIVPNGVPRMSGNDAYFVTAINVLNNKNGLFFWGFMPNNIPFAGGFRCVKEPIRRTPIAASGGTPFPANDCTGFYSFHFSQAYMVSEGLSPGTTLYGQYWSRDPGFVPPTNVGLTDGVQFTICP